MQKTLRARMVAGAIAACAGTAQAQQVGGSSTREAELPAVVVTGTPLGSGLFDLVQPADVLAGRRLLQLRRGSLGETLDGLPGVSATYFGPYASRPILRGMDGDRIRILQNGVGTMDASSLSFDHAVPYDPLAAERIEIVRGPAAVLHGGNAIGGVVNVIDNRIPDAPIKGITGRVEPRLGGPDRERSIGALLEAGNGVVALHADLFDRRTDDLKIPGFARSARQRALDGPGVNQPGGSLPNSNARADGGALGTSVNWGSGYAGLSYQGYNANYGSVPEPDVRISMKSERVDLAAEARELGSVISGVKLKLGRTHYEHRELDLGTVATQFRNRGSEGRIEFTHGRLGPLVGAFGLQFTDFDSSAFGAEAFVPATSTRSTGGFVYEELPVGRWKFSAGLRSERTRVGTEGGGPADPGTGLPRFDPAQEKRFSASSGAVGALLDLNREWKLAANFSSTQRAPTFYELFAHGPHAATGVYEIGNAAFAKEKSRSLDLGARWRSGTSSASVSVYQTRFSNFIALAGTGQTRGADGELNPEDLDGDGVADGSGEETLPEFAYAAVPARFRGIEAQARWRVYERSGTLDLELKADRVRAIERDTGQSLPRIAPTRIGASLEYTLARFSARVDVSHASAQDRVAANELPTGGYTLVNLGFGYRFDLERAALQAYLRVNNLFDREARTHASFLKEQAPLGGRAILVGMRGTF